MTTESAASRLLDHWRRGTRLDSLTGGERPLTRQDGYAIQAALIRLARQPVVGWKIAATSTAGQRHIGVAGPLAGRLLKDRVVAAGARVPLTGNAMRVAEAEFAFRFACDLPPRGEPYSRHEILDAVGACLPAIEIPDSRFVDVAVAGGVQLIADNACASWVTFGADGPADWRTLDLSRHVVRAFLNGALFDEGGGARVLGDPRAALEWLAGELASIGEYLRAGDVVITGTCVTPVPLAPGDRVRMEFGALGTIEAAFS